MLSEVSTLFFDLKRLPVGDAVIALSHTVNLSESSWQHVMKQEACGCQGGEKVRMGRGRNIKKHTQNGNHVSMETNLSVLWQIFWAQMVFSSSCCLDVP